MQNSISDLYALFRFLHVPNMGASLNAFKEHTKHGTASPELQSLLDCLMLRRRKCDTFGGRPLLPLPPKHIEVLSGRFSEAEQTLYNKIEAHSKRTFMNLMRRNGGVQANYIHILALLTRMRQACNAPQLVSAAVEKLDGLAAEEAAAEEARATTIPVPEEAAKRAEGMAGGEAHDCPICMDMVTTMDGVITACGHPYCRECIAQLIQHSEGRGDGAKCPLCRFTPLKLEHLFSLKRLLPQPEEVEDEGEAAAGAEMDDHLPRHSAKTRLVLDTVNRMVSEEGPTGKCLIFSCYTKYLDRLQAALTSEGHMCARLDGTMRLKERDRQISSFHGRNVPVLLMSLKCGVGLNLTVASTVLLCEPWWNPFVEEQAIDRVHRIGQTRPVKIYRLSVPGTVEEHILQLQEKKKHSTEQTLGDGVSMRRATSARLSERDFMRLFNADDADDGY